MQFSSRLGLFGNEVFAALNEKRRELEAQGRRIYDLSVGTPDFRPPAHVVEALKASADDPNSWKYSLHDKDELLQAVCDYYERRYGVGGITPDMVCSCHGSQEGMGHLGMVLLDPGDVALIPDPCYPAFATGVLLGGGTPAYYPLDAEHDFLPCMDQIDPEVADAAKYILVSLPANPVGSIARPGLYEEIIAFAKEHDLLVVHDNAYSDIVYEGEGRCGSFLAVPGALDVGVEFFSLSKSFDVTGARLSFLVGRPDVVGAFRKLRSQIDFGMFYPEQDAAIAALTGPLDSVVEQGKRYRERRDALCDGLAAAGWDRPSAHGSMFVWCRMPHGRKDSQQFVLDLMDKAGVIVTPGASFGPHGEGYVRMALVLPPEQLREACEAIAASGL